MSQESYSKNHLTITGDLAFDIQVLLDKYYERGLEEGYHQTFALDNRFNIGSTATRIGNVYVGWIQHEHGRNKLGNQVLESKTFRP